MLFIVEIAVAIIAAARGWGASPILLVVGSLILGLLVGATSGYENLGAAVILDWIIIAVLIVMALTGKQKSNNQISQPVAINNRVKCPYCAELILPEAKYCRYCGKEVTPQKELTSFSSQNAKKIPTKDHEYVICSNCRLEQWSGNQFCQKCGARFQG